MSDTDRITFYVPFGEVDRMTGLMIMPDSLEPIYKTTKVMLDTRQATAKSTLARVTDMIDIGSGLNVTTRWSDSEVAQEALLEMRQGLFAGIVPILHKPQTFKPKVLPDYVPDNVPPEMVQVIARSGLAGWTLSAFDTYRGAITYGIGPSGGQHSLPPMPTIDVRRGFGIETRTARRRPTGDTARLRY